MAGCYHIFGRFKGIIKNKKYWYDCDTRYWENYDFHPSNKHDVGKRFALLALNRTYGIKTLDSGPVPK